MVKSWNEFIEGMGDLNNPLSDIDKYLTGLSNKLILMQPEEVQMYRHKLTELRNLIERILDSQP